jgi:hypothetical protein
MLLKSSYRVVAVTPAGRQKYLEILLPYILNVQNIVDEYQLWVNTTTPSDIRYLKSLKEKHGGFVRLVWPYIEPCGRSTVYQFYSGCVDAKTVYIKLDDDICYIEDGAIDELVQFRIRNRQFLLIYPNVVNSALSSYIHQRLGNFGSSLGLFTYNPFCDLGWRSGRAAALIHSDFFQKLKDSRLDLYKYKQWVLHNFERNSINCISWFGEDFAQFKRCEPSADDEQWLAVDKPKEVGRVNSICGTSLMVHFAYYTQRDYLERETDFLAKYRRLAGEVRRR